MPLMKLSEAARDLGVSRQTIYNLIHKGKLPVSRLRLTGKKRKAPRIDSKDLDEFKCKAGFRVDPPMRRVETAAEEAAKSPDPVKPDQTQQRPLRQQDYD